jgi:hypothetical protein
LLLIHHQSKRFILFPRGIRNVFIALFKLPQTPEAVLRLRWFTQKTTSNIKNLIHRKHIAECVPFCLKNQCAGEGSKKKEAGF